MIRLHFTAAQAIGENVAKAGLTSGTLFRRRLGLRSQKLTDRPLEASAMYLLIEHYLERLPGAMKEEQLAALTRPWCGRKGGALRKRLTRRQIPTFFGN